MSDYPVIFNQIKEIALSLTEAPRKYHEYNVMIHKPTDIRRNESGKIEGVNWSGNWEQRKIIYNANESVNRLLKEYDLDRILLELEKTYEYSNKEIESILVNFFIKVFVEGYAEEDLAILFNDLIKEDISPIIYAKIKGLFTNEKEIQINNLLLRNPTDVDLTFEDHPGMSPETIHSVLIIKNVKGAFNEAQNYLEKIMVLFSLYKTAVVTSYSYRVGIKTFRNLFGLGFGGEARTTINYPALPDLEVKLEDREHLENFLTVMESLDIEDYIKNPNNSALGIALNRYLESLRCRDRVEARIMYTVMGLESLLLENEAELSYKLRMRLSKLLSILGDDSIESLSTIKTAYQIRSSFVHGSIIATKKQEEAKMCLDKSRNYLRKVLLFYLFENIDSKKKKSNFIIQLDKALVNDKILDQIRKRIDRIINLSPKIFI